MVDEKSLVSNLIAHPHPEHVVGHAEHAPTLNDFGELAHLVLKGNNCGAVLQHHVDQHHDLKGPASRDWVDASVVTGNDAGAFELANAAQAR